MKRDANDASFEHDLQYHIFLASILMSSRTSVCQPCCLPLAVHILASPLDCGHSFGLQDEERYALETADSQTYSWD
jgi:hypothetical protein